MGRLQTCDKSKTRSPARPASTAIGLLLSRCEQQVAAALFRKAEEIGKLKGVCRANLGLALLKGGKPDEPFRCSRRPHALASVPVMRCLIGLHSPSRQLRAPTAVGTKPTNEELLKTPWTAEGETRPRSTRSSSNARQKLEQQPREKPKPDGLTEL